MAMKKACCGMSTRMGTLIFLCLYLISFIWGIMCTFYDFGDPVYKRCLRDNVFLYWFNVVILWIGGTIFLATILSIIINASIILKYVTLDIAITFLNLKLALAAVYVMFRFFHYGEFDAEFNTLIEFKIDKFVHPYLQTEQRRELIIYWRMQLFLVYFVYAAEVFTVIYVRLVFGGYKAKLAENYDAASAARNVNNTEANFTEPSTRTYIFQFTSPQQSLEPIQSA